MYTLYIKIKQSISRIIDQSLCLIKKHKWGEGEAKQYCLRYKCKAIRVLMWNRRNPLKPLYRWRIYN